MWKEIKGKSLSVEFHRQIPIDEFIVDFFCHELMLAIEIDGNSHDYKYDKDMSRQNKLEKLGIHFIRFDDADVKKDMINVLRVLVSKIEELQNMETEETSP